MRYLGYSLQANAKVTEGVMLRVAADIGAESLMNRETVAGETPASTATS